jgi:F-type H+-transporting ATPase subunit delta
MSVESGVAERYASALFDLAKEQRQVEAIDKELVRASDVARAERALTRALVAPDIPHDIKRSIVEKVYGPLVSPLTLRFLHVLVEAQRFGELPQVASRYRTLMQDAEGQVQVEVETAIELDPTAKKQVFEEVARHTGRSPVVRWTVDPDLLGGVVVRIKDNIIDYSLKSQLHELRERLLRAQG